MAEGILDDIIGDDSFGDPDAEPHQIRIPYLVPGVVKSRKDPLGLGRVVLVVEGLFEDSTDWLTPLTSSGGSPNRGFFNPPRVGAVVSAFFPLGLIGPGFYIAGGWSKKSEIPQGALVEGNYSRAVFEDDQWLVTIDDRPGFGEVEIRHKKEGTFIQCKENGDVTVHAKAGKLQSDATEAMVLGNALKAFLDGLITQLNAHVHSGGTIGGLTGPVSPASFFTAPSTILSSLWKVK